MDAIYAGGFGASQSVFEKLVEFIDRNGFHILKLSPHMEDQNTYILGGYIDIYFELK